MDDYLIAACTLVLVVLVAVYVRDRRLRPTAGGSRLRWGLRWALLFVATLLATTIAYATPFDWLRVLTTLLVIGIALTIVRDLGFARRGRPGRGRYRSVRSRSTGIDGYRGD